MSNQTKKDNNSKSLLLIKNLSCADSKCRCIKHGHNECIREIICKGCGDCMAWHGYEQGTKYCRRKYICGRYNYKDDEIEMEGRAEGNTTLEERQKHRLKVFEKYEVALVKMRFIKKGTRYRKWLYNRLKYLSQKVFETEDEEYENICKWGRGIWTGCETTFKTKNEKEFIIKIAKGFGAFDY